MSSALRQAEPFVGLENNDNSRVSKPADILISDHVKLVERIARNVYSRMSASIPLEDLMQIGLIALIESAKVFEARGEAKFSTYAACRIRGAIIDELRHSATISRQALRDRRAFEATRAKLAGQLGRHPGDGEMAHALGIAVAAYRKAAAATTSTHYQSIDSVYSDNNSWFADPAPNALDALEHDQKRKAIERAIGNLPEPEAMVLNLFFVEELALEDIGRILGVTSSRICQMKKKAIEKVRRQLTDWA